MTEDPKERGTRQGLSVAPFVNPRILVGRSAHTFFGVQCDNLRTSRAMGLAEAHLVLIILSNHVYSRVITHSESRDADLRAPSTCENREFEGAAATSLSETFAIIHLPKSIKCANGKGATNPRPPESQSHLGRWDCRRTANRQMDVFVISTSLRGHPSESCSDRLHADTHHCPTPFCTYNHTCTLQ